MSIYAGNSKIKNVYVGTTPVKAVYVGTTKVRPVWKPGANTLVYYPLNGNANDYSGNGNNGTASNITWDSGGYGGCASFNGSNSYISIPSLTTPSNTTINFRVKTTMSADGEFIQLCSSTQSLEVIMLNGKTRLDLWNDGYSSFPLTSNKTINNGTRHNICVVRNGTSYTVYVDGTQDSTGTSNFSMSYTNNRIGLHTNGITRPFNGYIDNMIIESSVWTADEVSAFYNQTKSNYGL